MKIVSILLLAAVAVELLALIFCLARKKAFGKKRFLYTAAALVLVFFTGWRLLFPRTDALEPTGQYRVAREDCVYMDENRMETYVNDGSKRELSVSFWYPEAYPDATSCPLVVFSHGSLGTVTSNETLYNELASCGYVVCSVAHTYQCFSAKLSNGKTVGVSGTFMKELNADQPNKNPEQSLVHFKKWMDIRTGDLNFVLDTVLAKAAEQSGELAAYRLIDSSRICVMGHSLGGSAALGIGRTHGDISAVIALEAPFMCDVRGMSGEGGFLFDESEYPVPMLNVYSDSAWDNLRVWKQYAQNAYYIDNESDMYKNAHIEGIGHMALTDFSLTSPFLTWCMDGVAEKPNVDALRELNALVLGFVNNTFGH